MVRANLGVIDPDLVPAPVYGQVPAFAGGERDVIDLLAVENRGRLVVLELEGFRRSALAVTGPRLLDARRVAHVPR